MIRSCYDVRSCLVISHYVISYDLIKLFHMLLCSYHLHVTACHVTSYPLISLISDTDRLRMLVFKLYGVDAVADVRYITCQCPHDIKVSAPNKNHPQVINQQENHCLLMCYQAFIYCQGFQDLLHFTMSGYVF